MSITQIYIAASIAVLLIISLLVFFTGRNRKGNKISPLPGFAFGFILAGIIFGENRFIGYGLLGIGVLLAVIELFYRSRSK